MDTSNRFAHRGSDGEFDALVAEGLPEWPADGDLSSISDEDLGALHEAYLAEATEMASDPEFDVARANELTERIDALRTTAAERMAQAPEGDPAPAPAADPAADAADRDAALARLQGLGSPAPVEPAPVQLDTIDTAAVAAATAEGIARALTPLAEAVTTLATAVAAPPEAPEGETIPAAARRPVSAADLGTYRPERLAPTDADSPARRPHGRLVSAGDTPNVPMGAEFEQMDQLVAAMQRRWEVIGRTASGYEDEKVVVATYQTDDSIPESRDLRGITASDGQEIQRKIREAVGPKAIGINPWTGRECPIGQGGIAVADFANLVASGGLAAPVEPYYPQLLLAQADRPVMGALPTFVAERGGIKLVLPASLGTLTSATVPGSYADGVSNTDTSYQSATAAFNQGDAGQPIVGTDIPAGTTIVTVTNGTTVVLSAATTATATGLAFHLPSRNPNNLGQPVGLVTAAQDAAGPPNTVKYTYDVPVGTQAEFDVYSVYASLQFANLTARTFPEQVELNIGLANALAARVADQAALDTITNWSTLFTGAKTFGTARQLLAQFEHMAAYYRNHNRMDPAAVLRLGIPAWALNAMRADFISSFIGSGVMDGGLGLSDDELQGWFADRHILPFFYWDGPTDVSQLFSSPGSGAINTGSNSATPIAIPDYPGTGSSTSFRTKVVSFMWAEGTWLGLTTGELNLGLVRDSILNSQNRFRNFEEVWETPAFVGLESLRCVHTVAADGSYGSAVSVVLGAGNGL